MKGILFFLLASVIGVTAAGAQSAPAAGSNGPRQDTGSGQLSSGTQNDRQFPSGMILVAELSTSLDARKAKVGQKIEARLAMDVLSHGKIVIPRNSKVMGHVSEVKLHTKDSPDSTLGLVFDRVATKDRGEFLIPIAVQAIGRPLLKASLDTIDSTSGVGGMPRASMPGTGGAIPSRSATRRYPDPAGSDSEDTTPNESSAALGPNTKGVIGMKGVSLTLTDQTSVIGSTTENVHLQSGTQLVLRTELRQKAE